MIIQTKIEGAEFVQIPENPRIYHRPHPRIAHIAFGICSFASSLWRDDRVSFAVVATYSAGLKMGALSLRRLNHKATTPANRLPRRRPRPLSDYDRQSQEPPPKPKRVH
jgi:hypothetical protein